jgi:hypothetical protein
MKAFLKVYFKIILPISIVLAVLPILVLVYLKKFLLVNYLNVLFLEASVCFLVTLFLSMRLNFFFSGIGRTQFKISDEVLRYGISKEREQKISNSLIFALIGLTLLLTLFLVHFLSKLF